MINMEVPIQLPGAMRRPSGLFTDVAVALDLNSGGRDRLGAGVVHVPWGCEPVHRGNAEVCVISGEAVLSVEDGIITDASGLEPKSAAINDYPDQVFHPPFKVVDGLRCSSISFPHDTTPTASIGNRIRARMALQMSKMLMSEMVDGAASGGISLASEATALGAGTMAETAFAVETWLATVLHNGVGVVVLPVGLLGAAMEAGWVSASTMRTYSGHHVIVDAGFTGDPADPTALVPGQRSVFGMGVPGYASSSPALLDVASGSSHIDITDNVIEEIIEAYAQIAFDPCTVGEATLT